MGQAKLRGTFEQRQVEGIAKREIAEKLKRERIEALGLKTSQKQRYNRMDLALIMACAAATANARVNRRQAAKRVDVLLNN